MPEQRTTLLVSDEEDISHRLDAERARLRREAGLAQPRHFKRPVERAFTAEERDKVTILFGGLTWKHEELIRAVFLGNGYKCEMVPVPNVAAFQLGKEYGNNGQCNPTYFTVGNLVQYLQGLEAKGIPRQQILDNLDSVYREAYDRAKKAGDERRMADLDAAYQREQLLLEVLLDIRDGLRAPPPPPPPPAPPKQGTGTDPLAALDTIRRITKLR